MPEKELGSFLNPLSTKQELIINIMISISHPDEFYKTAYKSLGHDTENATMGDVAFFSASMKRIEAEAIYQLGISDYELDYESYMKKHNLTTN